MHQNQIKDDLYNDHWCERYSWHGISLSKIASHYNCSIDDVRALMLEIQEEYPKPIKHPKEKVCDSCGEPIIFIGKIPCNPPVHKFVIANGTVQTGRISHFATCPNADQHRRRK